MADSKVSELPAVTAVNGTDSLYVVQGSESKKATVAQVFATVATPASFTGTFAITSSETLTGAGPVSVAYSTSLITNPDNGGNLTIVAGVEGQIKHVIMTANSGSRTLALIDSQLGHTSITFDGAGDTATLIYTSSKWYFIGGTATVV